MRQTCEWTGLCTPARGTALTRRSHAVMCSVDTAADRQQYLWSNQIECCRARNNRQHPAHQEVGDKTLHICSLEHF